MEAIKDTVKCVIEDIVSKKSADNPEAWLKKALTKKELRHIRFKYFSKGILGLDVDSSSWLYQFNLQREGLLQKLQQQSGAIKDMRLRIGEIK